MLWVKRLFPIFLLGLVGFAYNTWQGIEADRRQAETRRWANLTTTIWEASARYYDEPDSFLAFRDSVLATNGLTLADVQAYLKRNRENPEDYIDYARLVNFMMDSLEQQRLKRESLDTLKADSIGARPLTPPR